MCLGGGYGCWYQTLRSISILMATAFVDMLGFAIIFPILPLYAERLGAETWVIGMIIASFSVAQLGAAPVWGRFSDRYGRRPALLHPGSGDPASQHAVRRPAFAYRHSGLHPEAVAERGGGLPRYP